MHLLPYCAPLALATSVDSTYYIRVHPAADFRKHVGSLEIIKEVKIEPITVYVIRNGDSDRSIHKVFLTEKSAKKYCDTYKESHNYECEVLVLTE